MEKVYKAKRTQDIRGYKDVKIVNITLDEFMLVDSDGMKFITLLAEEDGSLTENSFTETWNYSDGSSDIVKYEFLERIK